MAYREVVNYYRVGAETGAPRLSLLGMFLIGTMWPYWRWVWYNVEEEEDDR
jgi:hypothetical protein